MPKTLLLADDSVVIQKLVGLSFANEDVELVTTDNGDDALSRARELRPDLVLALTTPPFVGLLARWMAAARDCRHMHWVMDVYPDVLHAHGMVSGAPHARPSNRTASTDHDALLPGSRTCSQTATAVPSAFTVSAARSAPSYPARSLWPTRKGALQLPPAKRLAWSTRLLGPPPLAPGS